MQEYGLIATMLSFMVNFLLLLGANRLCGYPPGGLRAALASAFGAAQVALCMVSGFRFLSSWLWRLTFLLLMVVTAFGVDRTAVKRGLVFGLLQVALQGIAAGDGFWTVTLAALVFFLLCMAGKAGPGRQYVSVSITHGGKHLSLMALVDTGNTLRDPVTGQGVLILDAVAAQQLLGLEVADLARPVETLSSGKCKGLRLIPYTAVGHSTGLLLGLRVEQLRLDGELSRCIVAFAPQRIGEGRDFQALAGGIV